MRRVLLAVVILALVLVGCAPETASTADDGGAQSANVTSRIRRIVDCEAGVVLYTYSAGYAGALAIVPIADTTLDYNAVCGNR